MLELLLSLEITCSDFNQLSSRLFENNFLTQIEKQEILETLKKHSNCPTEIKIK